VEALAERIGTSALQFDLGQESHAGKKRQNDDRVGVFVPEDATALSLKGAAFIVCDGVSAADSGAEAADICVRGFLSDYFSMPDSWSVETSAQNVLTGLNRFLHSRSQEHRDPRRGFLCTLSALVIKSRTAHLFHIGDSRIYRCRDGKLELLTKDHKIPISETQSYLSRAMGLDAKIEIDHRRLSVDEGDVFLMTTDGVHGFVDDGVLQRQIADPDPQKAAQDLVEAAIAGRSDDNASCQVIRVVALPAPNQVDVHAALSALPFPPPLAPGHVIDGYRVLQCIHESPRSQLYSVIEVETGKKLAMKVPSVQFEDDDAYIERFVMEPWIGSRIRSAYVIASVVPKRRQTFLYHLQEYVPGVTLEQWMRTYPDRDVGEVMRIVEQVSRGLAALHRREIVHRDIKPDNVMILPDGQIKIIDLGACWVAGIDELPSAHSRDRAPVGTASYGAPELRFGGPVRARSDQFSLGVLTYELLTGGHPYGDALERARTEPALNQLVYVPAYQHNPLVPIWMSAAIRKAVRVDPTQRYDELSEFLHDLSNPNPLFLNERALPLLERNPLRFWKGFSLFLLVLAVGALIHAARTRAELEEFQKSNGGGVPSNVQ
jgi:serine/threonine protein kinase/serine/threonine protein phosphatase PrpC